MKKRQKGSKKTRGMVFGVFDRFHPGHEFFLREAAKNCNELIVVVTPDETVRALKGRLPVNDFDARVAKIRALEKWFTVIAGDADIGSWRVLKAHLPDIVLLGHDQQRIAAELDLLAQPYLFIDAHKPERYKSSLLPRTDDGAADH